MSRQEKNDLRVEGEELRTYILELPRLHTVSTGGMHGLTELETNGIVPCRGGISMRNYKTKSEIQGAQVALEIVRGHPPAHATCAVDRRREPRYSTDDPASMHLLNPLLADRQAIRVVEVSRNGMKIVSPMHLQRGTLIQVYIGDIIVMGEVRHSTNFGAEVHAGILIDTVFRRHPGEKPWNETWFTHRN